MIFTLLCGMIVKAEESLVKSEYSYRKYTTQDGFPNLSGYVLHQDSRGFIWIGSTRGFSRFDGLKFTNFLSETLYNIYHITSSPDGTVRAYSQHDVFIVNTKDSIRRVKLVADSLDLTWYNSRCLPEGYLIYESKGPDYLRRYLAFIKNDSVTELLHISELDKINKYSYPYIDNEKLYIPVFDEKIIYIFDLHTDKITGTLGFYANMFMRHSKSGLLAFSGSGVYSISGYTFTKITGMNDIPHNVYRCIETEDGSVFFTCYNSIYRFFNGKVEKKASLESRIQDLLYDKEKNFWGLSLSGLYNLYHFDFQNFTLENNFQITSFVEDEKGNFWFAANNFCLYKYSGNEAKKISNPTFIDLNGYNCAVHGYIYFSTYKGVVIKDKDKFRWAEIPQDESFNKILPLPGKEVLILSLHGLYRCTAEGKLIHTYDTRFLHQDEIFDVAIDKAGRWIVGGSKGVSIIDGDKVNLYTSEHSLFTLSADADFQGNIWSASENRLNLLKNDSLVITYRFNEAVQTLKVLKNGYLAVTTVYGLYMMNISNYLSKGVMQYFYYGQQNGMTGLYPEINGIYEDSTGMAWILTNDRMVRFDPQTLIRQASKPNLMVQNFAISKDNVQWQNVADFANTTFSYKNRNFKFSVIGLNYSAADNVRYHYRLLGFQNNWSEPTKQREITFNNLPPGNYTFEIYADAGTDESRCETQSFAFSIQPAFWQTAWFLVSCIAFLMLASAGAALYMQRRKNRTLMEKLHAEKELNELRISSIRLKAIPHFNANVLAAIEYYIANRTKEEAMHILGIYSDFTYKTLSDVDKAARPLSEELSYVKMYLDLEKIRFLDKFDFQINMDEGVDQTVQLPNMILHTFAENAIKHGLAPKTSDGRIWVKAEQINEGTVLVSVEDNGVGRKAASQNRNIKSSKQGLDILTRQIEIYNSFNINKIVSHIEDLADNDGRPAGTRFSVEIPLNYNYAI